MRKLTSGRLVAPYILLFYLFYILFGKIEPVYLKAGCLCDPARNYPIDTRTWKGGCFHGFFDASYVTNEGNDCYNVCGYFSSFFPADMVFPLVYTFMMLSMVNFAGNILGRCGWLRVILIGSIWIGMGFDYGEDFSFAGYLLTKVHGLAVLTSWFTTFKTCLLVLNMSASLILIGCRWLK